MDIRRFIIIFVIAVLYAIFVQSLIQAVYPEPEYPTGCGARYPVPARPMTDAVECPQVTAHPAEEKACLEQGGYMEAEYGNPSSYCPTDFTCNMCQKHYEQYQQQRGLVSFIVSAIFGLIAILIGLYLPQTNPLNEWVGFGFILGGLFSIFIGTAEYYQEMARVLRPIVMFLELVIVIYVAYKKIQLSKDDEEKPMRKKSKK